MTLLTTTTVWRHSQVITRTYGKFPDADFGGVRGRTWALGRFTPTWGLGREADFSVRIPIRRLNLLTDSNLQRERWIDFSATSF
jgi:hypothetical protein